MCKSSNLAQCEERMERRQTENLKARNLTYLAITLLKRIESLDLNGKESLIRGISPGKRFPTGNHFVTIFGVYILLLSLREMTGMDL